MIQKGYLLIILIVSQFLINFSYAQCPAGNYNNTGFFSGFDIPSQPGIANEKTAASAWGGDYYLFNVVQGNTYVFRTCFTENSSINTVLSLYNSTGTTLITFNDDFCGQQSQISWTATFTGQVRLSYYQSGCATAFIDTKIGVYYTSPCTAPTISTQPSNATVCTSNNTSFTVTASGTSLSYQWQVNTGSGFTNISNGGIYSNATTATLNLSGANSTMNGYTYRCNISNSCGNLNTNSATLNVSANNWTGAVNSNWATAGNWSCGIVPSSVDDITIAAGNPIVTAGTTANCRSLIKSGATSNLDISGATLNVYGDLTFNSGSILSNDASNIVFIGSGISNAQNFAGSLALSTNNLTKNGSSNLILNNQISVTKQLTLTAGTLTTGGLLRIAPTGSIIGNYSNLSGSVTLQKNIIGQRGWRMFAYPFTTTQNFSSLASTNGIAISTTPSGASGLTDVRSFTNGTTNGWNNVTASSTTANTPFALFIRGLSSEVTGLNYSAGPSAFTFSVNGTLNASPFTVTPSASNFTLVGNPFAAPVNSSALTNGTGKSYYVYQISQGGNLTAQRTKAGAWSTVLSSSATTPIPTLGVIAYQAGSASSYTVSTSDINTTNAATTGLFSTEKAIEHLELRVLQNGMQLDNLFVRQDAAATAAGTDGKDLQKLANEGLNVYTLTTADHHRLAVDARNLVGTTTIPLGVVGAVGNYTLQVANLNIEGVNVSLKDAFTNTTTALKVNSNYEFAITTDAASNGENRFELVLNKAASNIAGIDVTNAGKMTAKLLNGNINKSSVAQLEITGAVGKVEIRVTDMAGRLLHTQSGQNGRNTIQLGRKAGIQLITISDGTTTINQKMVKQ